MSAERLRVLELIKEGKVTPEEGLELLSVLNNTEEIIDELTDDFKDKTEKNAEISKFLRVNIQGVDKNKKFDIVLPTSLVRFLGGLGKETLSVNEHKIDINQWWEKQDSGFKGIVLDTCTKSGKEIKVELI